MSAQNSGNLPKMIKDYPIIQRIGKGGMGAVYLAKHPTLKRDVILKSLLIRNKESQERFLHEAGVMMDFRHENIAQVFDHFKEGKSTYIAMEYVKGRDLNFIIKEREKIYGKGNIPVPLALFILYQTALGLHHAHKKKVIHRDIKPHNILLSTYGEVKLVDFGIAAKTDRESNLTKPGTVIGTPAYMSPEQFGASKDITIQTDIYSLGVVFYEMITGVRPFKNEYSSEVIASIINGKYTPVKKIVKNVPPTVIKILKKTFNPNKNKRYKTLLPLIKTLNAFFISYNVFEIKDAIKKLVGFDKNLLDSQFIRRYEAKKKASYRAAFFCAAGILLAVLIGSFLYTNRFYEWFARASYGKVNLVFDKKNMDPDNIYITIDSRKFKANFKSERYSKIFYLKKGEHKFTVSSGSYINSKYMYIYPLNAHTSEKNANNEQLCDIPIANLWHQDVTVYFRFWDSINPKQFLFLFDNYTQMKIDEVKREEDNLKIRIKGQYIRLKDFIYQERKTYKRAPFYSGYTYNFKVDDFKRGNIKYLNKEFALDFELEERSVVTHITLTQTPAVIEVYSPKQNLQIFLNNSSKGLVLEKDNYVFKKYSNVASNKIDKNSYSIKIPVPPGNYTFKVTAKGPEKKLVLASGDDVKIKVIKENAKYKY
ncbi:MAG TPA: serine/threonine-protein kinase [Spirochaetota bacterium]|jgi:serine/threonine protein kinase|nr:MAG: Serine/threonine-protein kinase PrkC [Spirochaetes bacterium ADurb.Bin133]HNZ27090.1 serine/threonine-protein kinase [Spirochaetota bacterium]HPY87765.1 serine/threonine-protein kinase [Spirochaetota bacterium]